MTLLDSGFPLSAAISPRLQVVETVDSTNAALIRHVTDDPEAHPHLSVLLTRDQRAGRGRRDRTWTTPPGSALAVSVVLDVGAVAVEDRGWIPLIAGAAMTRAVGGQLSRFEARLKWPNDVMVEGRKICGILAEVVAADPSLVVVGAGVNTAMPAGELPVPTATSFHALGESAEEDRLLADYLTHLRDDIAALAVSGPAAVRPAIEEQCATLGTHVRVTLPDESTVVGQAERLDDGGRLVVRTDGGDEIVLAAGDVVHVRPDAG